MSLSILFDDAIDSCHIQIFMKVVIANVIFNFNFIVVTKYIALSR
jgi:hypothetical protein